MALLILQAMPGGRLEMRTFLNGLRGDAAMGRWEDGVRASCATYVNALLRPKVHDPQGR
jgi:hypothetical protein